MPGLVVVRLSVFVIDTSPRGDTPGFVVVEDDKTLLLPDRKGNNRIDSLRNIVADPHVALIFLIPGVGETLRVNGRASITTAPEVLERFRMEGALPRSVALLHFADHGMDDEALEAEEIDDEDDLEAFAQHDAGRLHEANPGAVRRRERREQRGILEDAGCARRECAYRD